MATPPPRSVALKELGRRLAERRAEAHMDVPTVAERAVVESQLIERFERGEGGLATGALTRIASVLGIPVAGLVSLSAPEVTAPIEPSALLLSRGTASLDVEDRRMLGEVVQRGRVFFEAGQLLSVSDLSRFVRPSPAPGKNAYRSGYACARSVRQMLSDYHGKPIRNLQRLIEDRFNILVVRRPFKSPAILGAACRSGHARVIILGASLKRESDVRMTLAHELCHHLLDLESDGSRIDEDMGDFSLEAPPEEQRAKAFAAMLLAPEDALQRELGPPKHRLPQQSAHELVHRARHVFGMGFEAMTWHLLNMKYLKSREQALTLIKNSEHDEVTGFEDELEKDGLERRAEEALRKELISEARYREMLGLSVYALPQ